MYYLLKKKHMIQTYKEAWCVPSLHVPFILYLCAFRLETHMVPFVSHGRKEYIIKCALKIETLCAVL